MPKIYKLLFPFIFHKKSWLIQLDTFIFLKRFLKDSVLPTYLSILYSILNVSFFFQLNLFLDRQLKNGSEVAFETHCTFFDDE